MRKFSFEEACRRYPSRFTMENVPSWALAVRIDGTYHAPLYATDKEWYERTFFHNEHELATKYHCYSTHPTWPLGKSLTKPFHREAL